MVSGHPGRECDLTSTMRLLAPAKINLFLRVGRPMANGFHPLSTWMCAVGLFDTLELRQKAPANRQEASELLSMTCDDAALPCDQTNLVMKAGRKIVDAIYRRREQGRSATREAGAGPIATGVTTVAEGPGIEDGRGTASGESEETLAPVAVELRKRIPHGSGLGGGSSDGARMMLGLNRLWKAGLAQSELMRLAGEVGSDMPFFIGGPSALCTGRGEKVDEIAAPMLARWAVLVLPEILMPTAAVYRQFDEMRLGETFDSVSSGNWESLLRLSANKLLPLLVNDLEPPSFALNGDLGKLRQAVEGAVGRPVRMS